MTHPSTFGGHTSLVTMFRLVRSSSSLSRLGSRGVAQRRADTSWQGRPRCLGPPTRLFSSDTDFKPSEELAKERYDSRANEDLDRKRARLLYQSRKRGMLENGVILASFADKYLNTLDADHLDQYDRLINLPTNDWDIYYWATNTKPTPPEFETPVLSMLREHLKSKVSNEESPQVTDCVLGKTRLDDVVLPAIKKRYDLDIDVSKVDLSNYKEELFDDRIKTYKTGSSIQLMTDWRKKFLEHQLKRVIASPTSVKTLDEEEFSKSKVYTQKFDRRSVGRRIAEKRDLIDSKYERAMKHHDLLQHFLGSSFTEDALEYDDEAEAWANMLWHRNYGSHDDKISPSRHHRCNNCQSVIHCCDPGLEGYIPREIFINACHEEDGKSVTCQRCNFRTAYKTELDYNMSPSLYENFLRKLNREPSLFVVLIDLTDFPSSIWEGLIDLLNGRNNQFLIVGNKLDLLPYDGPKFLQRVGYSFRKGLQRLRPGNQNLRISDTVILSARTGYGVESLVTRILERVNESPKNVHLIGSKNSGKSTLFDALLQSDLNATRKSDLISRISSYQLPGQEVKMLRFPIDLVDGWQNEMKKRKSERVERNYSQRLQALSALSQRRQDSMPHMSTLINRLVYDPPKAFTSIIDASQKNQNDSILSHDLPRFSDDHPLAAIQEEEPMSADQEKFKAHGFLHMTPSSSPPDQLHSILTNDERLEVFPNETIVPRKYSLRPLTSLFIAGLARLDLLTCQSNVIVTIFASKYLPVHVVRTKKADQFYDQFLGSPYLGVPFGDDVRLAAWPGLQSSETDFHIKAAPHNIGAADIVFSSFGWALVTLSRDQECIVRAFTPGGKGVFLREPPLLARASKYSLGKKIRDTPVFKHPHYISEVHRLESQNQ